MAKNKPEGPKYPRPQRIKLAVIPDPQGTRAGIKYEGEGEGTVIMRGPGHLTMECGNCGADLLVGVATSQVRNMVFRCNSCKAWNETLD